MDPILFRGVGDSEALGAPLILARHDEDFVDALLAQLRAAEPVESVRRTAASSRDGAGKLRLYQPVHRTFHVVAMEIGCDTPGAPRLDPAKIESSGLVVRRVSRVADPRRGRNETYPYAQAWLSNGSHVRGWVTFDSDESASWDPDETRRPQPSAGPAEVNARLRLLLGAGREPQKESTSPLFVAPPDVCARAQRTVLFGMIPTVSVEAAEAPRAAGARFFDDADLQSMIPAYLRSDAPPSLGDVAGRSFSFAEASAREQQETRGPRSGWHLKNFLTMLRQLATQFRAFDDTERGRALLALLDRIELPFAVEPKSRLAGAYLADAARLLVLEPDPERNTRVELPLSWPATPGDVARGLAEKLGQMAEAAFADISPRATRFDDLSAYYHVRAFVRVKREDGCPPVLIWSRPSEPFSIAPWYENGQRPPVSVQMPDLTRANVKSLKPNVVLKLPRRLFNFMNENDPKDLLDGKGKPGSSIGIDWICGFNIPIITICAFIVLFIFLALLNIVFWWLPFIRICFPIPSLKQEGS